MHPFSRRRFLALAGGYTGLLCISRAPAAEPPRSLRIGVCADVHQDVLPDTNERLRKFIDTANREQLYCIIQLGDFCRPDEKARGFLRIWEEFRGPRFHTLGNHDKDGGFEWPQVQKFLDLPRRYYSVNLAGWHLVVLDGNEVKPGNRAAGYPRYVGAEQQAWLRRDLKETSAPTLVFSHQSLADPDGVENGNEVRGILEEANVNAGWRKVGACICGHHHIDFAAQTAGIHYVFINSMSYQWLGEKFKCERYSPEVNRAFPYAKFTVPYRDPLYSVFTLSPAKGLEIQGRESVFLGPSPWDLGMEEVKGTARDKTRLVPRISNRQFLLQTGPV